MNIIALQNAFLKNIDQSSQFNFSRTKLNWFDSHPSGITLIEFALSKKNILSNNLILLVQMYNPKPKGSVHCQRFIFSNAAIYLINQGKQIPQNILFNYLLWNNLEMQKKL